MKRRFGTEQTALELSSSAYNVYLDTDPLVIWEIEDEDGELSYSLEGCIVRHGLSAEALDRFLVELGEAAGLGEEESDDEDVDVE